MRIRPFVTAVAAVIPLLSAARAEAHPTTRLDYARGEGAEICPDASAMQSAVAARLGYEPFEENAADLIEVRIVATPRELAGTLVLRGADGTSHGDQRLTSTGKNCVELASSLALAISIAIDPLAMSRSAPAQEPAPTPAPAPPAAPDPPHEAPAPRVEPPPHGAPPEPLHLRIGALAAIATGVEPSASVGFAAILALHSRRWELGLEARGYLSSSTPGPAGGAVSASLLQATLAPCVRQEIGTRGTVVVACVLGSLGALSSAGQGLDTTHQAETLEAAVGARLGGDLAVLGSGVFLRALVDGTAALSHTTLRANGVDVWTTPPLAIAAGLGIAGEFL